MEIQDKLKKFGIPVSHLLLPANPIDPGATYTVVNISDHTVVIPQTLSNGTVQNLTLNPFGFVNCAGSLPGSVVNSLNVRQFWAQSLLAILPGDLDTSFLLNAVPLHAKNPYSTPFFTEDDLTYSVPGESYSDPGIPLTKEQTEAIAKPIASKLQTATLQGGRKRAGIEISGEFRPENADR